MITQISTNDAAERLQAAYDGANFPTFEAAKTMVEYLEILEEDQGEPTTFDAIAICTEWTTYESVDELLEEVGLVADELADDGYDPLEYFEDTQHRMVIKVLNCMGVWGGSVIAEK
jgi:hypothetical protein